MTIQIDNATLVLGSQIENASMPKVVENIAVEEGSASENIDDVVVPITEVEAQAGREALENSVNSLNDFVQNVQRSIHFSISEASGRTVIEVYDKETDELIRSIPSEEAQRLSDAIEGRLSEGLLLKIAV